MGSPSLVFLPASFEPGLPGCPHPFRALCERMGSNPADSFPARAYIKLRITTALPICPIEQMTYFAGKAGAALKSGVGLLVKIKTLNSK